MVGSLLLRHVLILLINLLLKRWIILKKTQCNNATFHHINKW